VRTSWCKKPSTIRGADWGANVPMSPVVVGPDQPDSGIEPAIVFLVPVGHWSNGTQASGGHR
jgi:hypothetical protein